MGGALELGGQLLQYHALAITPCSTYLATGASDFRVAVWHLGLGSMPWIGRVHSGPVRAVAFNTNGSRLVSGGDDKSLLYWDMDKSLAQAAGVVSYTWTAPSLGE